MGKDQEWEALTKLRMAEPKLGYRGEVGLITPISGSAREWEAVRPLGLRFSYNSVWLESSEPEQLKAVEPQLAKAAAELNVAQKKDLIVLVCTAGSFVGGPGYEKHLERIMTDASGSPSLTVISTVLDLFKDMGIKKIALVGPYLKETFDLEVKFLEAYGIHVLYVNYPERGLGPVAEYWAHDKDPYAVYRWVLEAAAAAPDADAIFVSCVVSSILYICQQLEEVIGKPVISSQSALFYGILKLLKIPDPIPPYGQALTRPRL